MQVEGSAGARVGNPETESMSSSSRSSLDKFSFTNLSSGSQPVKDVPVPKCDSITHRKQQLGHLDVDKKRSPRPAVAYSGDHAPTANSSTKSTSGVGGARVETADEQPRTTSTKNRYRVAIIETTIIGVVVIISLIGLLTLMYFFAVRPQVLPLKSKFKGETPESAWRKYDEQEQIEPGNLCQNFPGLYQRFIRFIKRPYQIIGSPCDNYYGLVCSGICHLVPNGLCFWEALRKFMQDCYDYKLDVDTLELWMDLDAFSRQANIPRASPSPCMDQIERAYGDELSLIHGGNTTIKLLLFDRLSFYISYINSKRFCVEERLMMYESFCLSHCCYKPDGDIAVEIGRILCQATVGWRSDFTTYFRCQQNRDVIHACWQNDTEPPKCRPR